MEAQNSEETHVTIPTFHTKPENVPDNSYNGIGDALQRGHRRRRREQSSSSSGKKTKRNIIKESSHQKKEKEEGEEEEEEEDREEIERKIEALQRIVPGGESLGMDKLFDETAGYIITLRYQIKGLRALSIFFERLEKEKSKLGG